MTYRQQRETSAFLTQYTLLYALADSALRSSIIDALTLLIQCGLFEEPDVSAEERPASACCFVPGETINVHAYHYAGNNPVRLRDPDGNQSQLGIYGPQDFFDFGAFIGDPFCRLLDLFRRADSGDQAARNYIGAIWQEAKRDVLKSISDGSSKATLVFLAVGAPEAAAVSSAIGLIADSLLVLDDITSGNYRDALAGGAIIVAGVVFSKAAGKLVNSIADRGISISMGKNGRFYELGRQGAMKTRDAFRALVASDIANGIFGDLAPEAGSQLLKSALKAFDELSK